MNTFTPPGSGHRNHMIWKGIFLLCLMLLSITTIKAQTEEEQYDPFTLLFTLTEEAFAQEYSFLTIRDDIFRETGVPVDEVSQPFSLTGDTPYWRNFYSVTVKKSDALRELQERMADMKIVSEVLRVPMVSTFQVPPNDTHFASQWHLNTVQAQDAWNRFTPPSSLLSTDPVVIAVVDDAVDIHHPDLVNNLWTDPATVGTLNPVHGHDFADGDGNPAPPASANGAFFNHGTHVAGIANAETENALGIAALAYNVQLMSLKCAADNSANPRQFGILAVVNGINYAVNHGADIINLSLGTDTNFPPLEQAILNARANDVMVVAAAGNDDSDVAPFPAGYPDVITVASTDGGDQRSSFSNYGPWVDISAPGSNIFSTLPGSGGTGGIYGNLSGTSMAAPLVASALALMKTYRPTVPNDFLIDCLLNNATDISTLNPGYVGDLGSGRLNVDLALQCTDGLIANFTSDLASACVGQTITFTATPNAGATYSWDFGDGTPATAPSTATTISHTYNGALANVVTLTVHDGTSTATDQRTVVTSSCQINDPTQGHWYFGNQLAVDFTSGVPQADQSACINGTIGGVLEVAATMSDANGNLLFYTDGERVWDNNHNQLNSNSNLLIVDQSMTNGVIIAPVPGSPDNYYIFHGDAPFATGNDRGLHYTVVNTAGGTVSLTSINNAIGTPAGYTASTTGALQTGEQLTIVPNCDGYWLITTAHTGTNMEIVLFSVSPSGIQFSHGFDYGTGTLRDFNFGYLKASPDGTRLAYSDNNQVNMGIHLMDFDPVSGTISNLRQIETHSTWGLTFSPNSQVLYATRRGLTPTEVGLWQYDLSQPNPTGVDISGGMSQGFAGIQLGPDGKIYAKQRLSSGHPFLSTIHFPDQVSQPGFVFNDVDLNPTNQSCAGSLFQTNSFGLPNLIDAKPVILEDDQFTYTVSNCYTVDFQGPACSSAYLWNFNDGKDPTSTVQNPTHVFSGPGTYDVILQTDNFSILQTIVINDIDADVIGKEEICEDEFGGAFSYFVQTGSGNYSYQWTATGGNIITDPTLSLIDVEWTTLPARLTVIVTDEDTGCEREIEFEVNACIPPENGCTNCTEVVEQLKNGDFEMGPPGVVTFNSQLNNVQGCFVPGTFHIGNRARSKCPSYAKRLYDHTFGNRKGNYMIIDEYQNRLNYLVWLQQGISVTKGEKYIFSFWHLRNLTNSRVTQFQEFVLWVDGHAVDTISTQGATDQVWTRYCVEWEADRNGNVPVAIYRVNNTDPTLPYGIDDISFGACVDCEVQARFSRIGLYNSPWRNFYDRSLSSGTITSHSWDFGDPASGVDNTSTLADPSHRFTSAGTFEVCLTVTATQGGETCESTKCRKIRIVKERVLTILPNPVKKRAVKFELKEGKEIYTKISSVVVYRASNGRPLIVRKWKKGKDTRLSVASLRNGVYILEVVTKDGQRLKKRFVIRR